MREALFTKSIISQSLADLYQSRDKNKESEEFSLISESCAKEFNNMDKYIEDTFNKVCIKSIEI